MSSYLLFFATGNFERLAAKSDSGAEVGIVSPKGSGEQARFALDSLGPLLGYYSDYFGQPYPLPKLDNVAGPGQSQFFGAMENRSEARRGGKEGGSTGRYRWSTYH